MKERMEVLESIMIQMLALQKQQEQQKRFLELLLNKTSEERTSVLFNADSVANSISEFVYNPDTTFSVYCRRYLWIFKEDCSHWNNVGKVRLLLWKLSPLNMKYVNFVLHKKQMRWILSLFQYNRTFLEIVHFSIHVCNVLT